MEHALATGLYTTGAGQSSTMLVTELGPSLAMLGPLHQELSNVRLTPQLGGLLAHGGTTELRRNTKAGWRQTLRLDEGRECNATGGALPQRR